METTTRIVTIAGFARNGKDTMYSIINHYLHQHTSIKCKNLKLADSLRRMVQEECVDKHGINAWTEDAEEKQIIRPILIERATKERADNPDIFCDNLFEYGGVKPGVLNIITDLRYYNELQFIESAVTWENRFHIWVSRGDKFGPVGSEEEQYTVHLKSMLAGRSNCVFYDWEHDMDGAGWSVWDKATRESVEGDVLTKVINPLMTHLGIS
jgi:hypothetical protein